MAQNIERETLYQICTTAVIENFPALRGGLDLCPENLIFDVIFEVYKRRKTKILTEELSHFPTFCKLLKIGDKRSCLHKMLQSSVDNKKKVPQLLAQSFSNEVDSLLSKLTSPNHNQVKVSNTFKTLELGFNLGGFLCEAGWYPAATTVYRACVNILRRLSNSEPDYFVVKLECLTKLLHSLSNNCQFSEASNIYTELTSFVWDEEITSAKFPALACIYSELSSYHFMKSNYHESYNWAMESVKLLSGSIPPKLSIDVMRQASKSCVVKREFSKAEMLVKQAVNLAKSVYGDSHPKYADCLVDYGFYLLNVDCITASMKFYQTALDVRKAAFGGDNLQVALAHEDLAYATYVHEYSSGKFSEARNHAETSLRILAKHLPLDHLLLASSKRVLALILEEIAIDSQGDTGEKSLLYKAEDLHLFALNLAKLSFGECNVQTAKHYGNLGRLYQTMERYQKAETMHLKAIQIKETLLGAEDYEVALSVGHLASLYNYDMKEYNKAEQLYLRSIKIGRKLFGPSYSGLEYDYRGLIQVYHLTRNYAKFMEYQEILDHWRVSREMREAEQGEKVADDGSTLSLTDLIQNVTKKKEDK